MTQPPSAPILPADDMALLPAKEAAPIVGVKPNTIREWVKAHKFPHPLRLSYRCSRFRAGDIRAWLADPKGWHQGKAIDAQPGALRAGSAVEV